MRWFSVNNSNYAEENNHANETPEDHQMNYSTMEHRLLQGIFLLKKIPLIFSFFRK